MKRVINGICVLLAFVFVGVGIIGIFLPILPSTPFFVAAMVLFAKGSRRFHQWFLSTGLYKKYVHDLAVKKSMTGKAKLQVMVTVSLVFAVGIIFSPVFAKVIMLIVWLLHVLYFVFVVKTRPETLPETAD